MESSVPPSIVSFSPHSISRVPRQSPVAGTILYQCGLTKILGWLNCHLATRMIASPYSILL